MSELSGVVQWPAFFSVAASTWTPSAYAGYTLYDASTSRFLITDNTADVLILKGQTAPNPGITFAVAGAAWTAGQYANTPNQPSYLVDSTGARFLIYQSTTSLLVLAGNVNPAAGPWSIVQGPGGGQVVTSSAQWPGSVTLGTGFWSIVEPDGTPVTSSATNTGAVTATEGAATLDATGAGADNTIYSSSEFSNGIIGLSVILRFLSGSSPNGTFVVRANNKPGPDAGGGPDHGQHGPPANDPLWTPIPTSLDGAAATIDPQVIDDLDPHEIVIAEQALTYHRWLDFGWTPNEDSPGTGPLSAYFHGFGFGA